MRSPRPRSWWLAALLTGLTTTGCQELSRTIEEVVTVVTLAVAFGIVVLALVFLGLAVRGLVKRERTKAPLVGFVVFGAVPVAIALWWAVYALVESYPHEPILLTPLLGVWAWLIQLPLALRAGFDRREPALVGGAFSAVACVLLTGAALWLWPRVQMPSGDVVQLALSHDALCVRFEGGEVVCDGRRDLRGAHGSNARPVRAPDAIDVAIGDERACLVTEDHELWCWDVHEMPERVRGGVTDVEMWGSFPITRGADGRWSGPIGVEILQGALTGMGGGTLCSASPELAQCVDAGQRRGSVHVYAATRIAVHGDTLCALEAEGRVRCVQPLWNEYPRSEPVQELSGASEVVVGRAHGCARAGDGSVRCWGDYTGGGPIASDRAYVVQVPPVSALVAADTYTCALAAGEVWCWGSTPMQLDVEASHRTSHSLFGSSRHAYYPSPAHPIWD